MRMSGEREIPEIRYIGSSREDFESYADVEYTEKKYLELLMSSHDREIAQGATLYGIHKDDLEISLNGKAARIYGSQGQQRSISVTMKLAEGEICKQECGEYPVFLFDDVFSELDASRRGYLSGKMKDRQVIMTTCEPSGMAGGKLIRVEKGTFYS